MFHLRRTENDWNSFQRGNRGSIYFPEENHSDRNLSILIFHKEASSVGQNTDPGTEGVMNITGTLVLSHFVGFGSVI